MIKGSVAYTGLGEIENIIINHKLNLKLRVVRLLLFLLNWYWFVLLIN